MPIPSDFSKTTFFLKEQLTKTLPRIYSVEYAELWGLDPTLNYHQATADLPLGLEQIDAWIKDNLGRIPALFDGQAGDIPTVDVEIGKKSFKVALFALKTDWNLLQIEKERVANINNQFMPNMNLIATKQDAVADFFNRGDHNTILWGYPKVGIRGLFTQTGIATTDNSFTPYKKTSGTYDVSAMQLYEDFVAIINSFMVRAKLTSATRVQMKLPRKLHMRLLEIPTTSNGNTIAGGATIKQLLRSTEIGLGVSDIQEHDELHGATLNANAWNDSATGFLPANRDRIMFKAIGYQPQRSFYTRRPFSPFQLSTIDYEQITIGATTGIMNLQPEKTWYYDFSNVDA
jgi:hypothetical protein